MWNAILKRISCGISTVAMWKNGRIIIITITQEFQLTASISHNAQTMTFTHCDLKEFKILNISPTMSLQSSRISAISWFTRHRCDFCCEETLRSRGMWWMCISHTMKLRLSKTTAFTARKCWKHWICARTKFAMCRRMHSRDWQRSNFSRLHSMKLIHYIRVRSTIKSIWSSCRFRRINCDTLTSDCSAKTWISKCSFSTTTNWHSSVERCLRAIWDCEKFTWITIKLHTLERCKSFLWIWRTCKSLFLITTHAWTRWCT